VSVPARHIAFFAGGLVVLAIAADLSAARYGPVVVTPQPVPQGQSTHGYVEYSFVVANNSPRDEHVVTLVMPQRAYGRGNRIQRMTRSVAVGPGSSARLSLFQPPLPISGSQVQVLIDGQAQAEVLGMSNSHMQTAIHHGGTRSVHVLLSRRLNRSDVENSFDRARPLRSGSRRGRDFVQMQGGVSWSEKWLAYSRFDSVMISAGEWTELTVAARSALLRYVEVGGQLVVVGGWQLPEGWSANSRPQPYGHQHDLGFGKVAVVSNVTPRTWDGKIWKPVADGMVATSRPFQHIRDVQSANREFPVVEHLGIPVRGLFLLMLLFAVLIGPVNLVVLAKKRRKIWMLWTVPVISLLFCGMVFAYNIFAEGFTAYSRTQTVTILDQVNRRASTIGWAAYYSPLTPSGGLRFSYDTELTPHVQMHYYSAGRGRSVDWTSEQQLSSGWIAARVPAHFLVRKSEVGDTGRLRVEFTQAADGTVQATNGLKVRIVRLSYADAEGRIHEAEQIEPGARAQLKLASGSATASRELRSVYANDWILQMRRLAAPGGEAMLRGPGRYVAVIESSPFLRPGLGGAEAKAELSVVVGITGQSSP